jgi:hypothetical protein
MGFFNRGGSSNGEPVRAGDKAFGVNGAAKNKGKGKVTEVKNSFGDDVVSVDWDNGGSGQYRQWELGGTNL